uniref:Uncharacterized protein n=1 Tax=Rhizophora mucronata TaxID=61149 RepID=A0A2P2PWP9_RHIMU
MNENSPIFSLNLKPKYMHATKLSETSAAKEVKEKCRS